MQVQADKKAEIVDQVDGDDAEDDADDDLGDTADSSDATDDDLYDQAVSIVRMENKATVSLLQRRLNVGYARAARIMDEMEQKSIIGPYEGAKPRAVLISRQQWLEMQMNQPEE